MAHPTSLRLALGTLALLLTGTAAYAQTYPIDTLRYNGSSDDMINFVFLPDGYQEGEMDDFLATANEFVEYFFNTSPFNRYENYFNFFAIRVPSPESGVDHPGTATDVGEPAFPVSDVESAFNSSFDSYGIHRLLVPQSWMTTSVLFNHIPQYHQGMVLVNTGQYGGSGGYLATSSAHSDARKIMIHEIGHSFADLADEYYAGDSYAGERPNMTQQSNPDSVKWAPWMGSEGIGIYQHCCGGESAQWYRPHQNCMMKALNAPGFCAVCREAITERIHELRPPALHWSPATATTLSLEAEDSTLFSVTTLRPEPNTLRSQWWLGSTALGAMSDSLWLASADLPEADSDYLLRYTVIDTTSFQRVPQHDVVHLQVIEWTVRREGAVLSTSLAQSYSASIGLSPNPASDLLRVQLHAPPQLKPTYRIYSLQGSQLASGLLHGPEQRIDISHLSSGSYILQVSLDGGVLATQKFIRK